MPRHSLRAPAMILVVSALVLLFSPPTPASAQDGTLKNACKQDIETHCSQIPPGRGRVLACLVGSRGVLSDDCELAVGLVEKGLQEHRECLRAFRRTCGAVEPGEGRLRACYQANAASLDGVCADLRQQFQAGRP